MTDARVTKAADPARLALWRRRATVIALALTGAAGALATAAHAIFTGFV